MYPALLALAALSALFASFFCLHFDFFSCEFTVFLLPYLPYFLSPPLLNPPTATPTPPQRSSRRFGGTRCGHPLQKNPYPYDKTLVIFFSASGSGLKGLDIYPLEASVCIHSVRHPLEASVCIHSVRHPLEASALPPHLP